MARFSVIGSCVSRDVLSFIDGDVVGEYLARTSLASIASRPSAWAQSLPIEFTDKARPWHRRMVAADINKTHPEMIAKMADDWVLIDLIDERVYLVETEPGELITLSQILSHMSNFDAINDRVPLLIFSDAGYDVWLSKLEAFRSLVTPYVQPNRILLHRALYGSDLPAHKKANRYLARMYDRLSELFPEAISITPPAELIKQGLTHKWGLAPYHYIDAYYLWIVERIEAAAGIELPRRVGWTLQMEVEQANTD